MISNTEKLEQACQDYLDFHEGPDYNEDEGSDYENEVFEAAMKAVLGDKVFDRINAAVQRHEAEWKRESDAERLVELEAELAALKKDVRE